MQARLVDTIVVNYAGDVVLNVQMKTANNESSIGPTILKIIDPTTPVITDEGSWKQATISLEPSPNADYQASELLHLWPLAMRIRARHVAQLLSVVSSLSVDILPDFSCR